MLLSYDIIKVM